MEQPRKEKHIEIQPTGLLFEVDKQGFLVNPASMDKVQEHWRPVVKEYVQACKDLYGDDLVSVYIRGSVAKGKAIDGISDLDAFVVLQDDYQQPHKDLISEKRKSMAKNFPFVNGFEFEEYTQTGIQDECILLNQSFCIFGEEIKVPAVKLSKDLALHAPNFQSRHNHLVSFIQEENPSKERIKNRVEWLGKGILRTGLEILIEKSGKYTRDLYPCYQVFSEYYPEKESQMRAVLDLVLNSNTTQERAREVLLPMSEFILEESKKIYKK